MNKSKYIDTMAMMNVIGCIYKSPSLLDDEEKYHFSEEDFPVEFHRIIFSTIYNLHIQGAKNITLTTIEDYLSVRPATYGAYISNKGAEYLTALDAAVRPENFDYYYQRLKKFTLLRMYNEKCGMDLSNLYDVDNIADIKKKQAQEEWLDNSTLEEIADIIDKKIIDIRLTYVDNADESATSAGDGLLELISKLRETPEVGYPLYGHLINTITRGARLKKLYLRSASSGVGKTRSMIADACYIACDELYDSKSGRWTKNGTKEPVIFISTEQEKDEIQTMMLAFLSDVDEEHILTGQYIAGEWERIVYAAKVIKNCPLYIQQLSDFSLQDIENTIKRGVRDFGCRYIFFDYIHSSMKILSEVTSKAGVKGLREDNVLFMIAIRLKDLCNQYGVFIMTATQLNGDYKTEANNAYDQNMLRGAKAIADKADFGAIMLEATAADIKALESAIKAGNFDVPQIKISIYKNRRGRYKNIMLWCKADRGTCKINPIFATDRQYKLIPIEDSIIEVEE